MLREEAIKWLEDRKFINKDISHTNDLDIHYLPPDGSDPRKAKKLNMEVETTCEVVALQNAIKLINTIYDELGKG